MKGLIKMSPISSHMFPYRSLQRCCVCADTNTLLPSATVFWDRSHGRCTSMSGDLRRSSVFFAWEEAAMR